jgi:hypothetical protein
MGILLLERTKKTLQQILRKLMEIVAGFVGVNYNILKK